MAAIEQAAEFFPDLVVHVCRGLAHDWTVVHDEHAVYIDADAPTDEWPTHLMDALEELCVAAEFPSPRGLRLIPSGTEATS